MQRVTEELLKELKNAKDIEAFFKANEDKFLNQTTSEYLNELLIIKGLSVATVAKESGVGEYTYKVFGGDRKPSRDIAIAISFGMKLSLEEAQLLLRISKFAILDSRDKRDSIIIYALTHGSTLVQADDMLFNNGLATLN